MRWAVQVFILPGGVIDVIWKQYSSLAWYDDNSFCVCGTNRLFHGRNFVLQLSGNTGVKIIQNELSVWTWMYVTPCLTVMFLFKFCPFVQWVYVKPWKEHWQYKKYWMQLKKHTNIVNTRYNYIQELLLDKQRCVTSSFWIKPKH